MRKKKADRRLLRIPLQKKLLVFHNQIVGICIVGGALSPVAQMAVGHLSLFVHGEIAGVGELRLDVVQIADIVLLSHLQL